MKNFKYIYRDETTLWDYLFVALLGPNASLQAVYMYDDDATIDDNVKLHYVTTEIMPGKELTEEELVTYDQFMSTIEPQINEYWVPKNELSNSNRVTFADGMMPDTIEDAVKKYRKVFS
jgi:hypothetical protein